MVTFTFSGANQITLTNGTNYVVTFEYPDGTNFPSVLSVDVGYDSSSPTHGGNYYDDSVLITALYDLAFNVTGGSAATPLIDAVSGTDSGFSGTPDNTDPFTSGQSVTYTVQSPLTPGNYYVRVRAKDPSGTNTWSSWSATTSFNVAVPTTISVYSVTEYYDGDGSSTGNMSLTLPATIPSGSLGIYVFNQNTSAATVTSAPAGATLIDLDTSSANTDRTWAYWEPLGTSDQSASRAFNFSSSGRHTAQLYLLTGADTSTPIEDYATANATAVSSYANNNLTATADGQMRLSFWSTSLAGPTVITPTYPLGYNAGATTHGAWASAANLGIHSAYKAILTGTSGGDTATFDNTTVSFVMFDILIKASSGTTGQVKVWNGSAWVAKPVKVWNGSSWVTKPLKRWNGSAWVATTY